MSLSPLVSFKSRFVTYLLNFPRKKTLIISRCTVQLTGEKNSILSFMAAYISVPCSQQPGTGSFLVGWTQAILRPSEFHLAFPIVRAE